PAHRLPVETPLPGDHEGGSVERAPQADEVGDGFGTAHDPRTPGEKSIPDPSRRAPAPDVAVGADAPGPVREGRLDALDVVGCRALLRAEHARRAPGPEQRSVHVAQYDGPLRGKRWKPREVDLRRRLQTTHPLADRGAVGVEDPSTEDA